ncbi:MAG: hypothetical protein KKB50_15825 [Planctomycetes bacterium]|nr:hypothetical protein [Planctomycetota bacterium]
MLSAASTQTAVGASDLRLLEGEGTSSPDFKSIISAEFASVPGRIDIRSLWAVNGTARFRVNWWRLRPDRFEEYIQRSAFVAVESTECGLIVRELTAGRAA